MSNRAIIKCLLLCCLSGSSILLSAQQTTKLPVIDSVHDSHIRSIKTVGIADTTKAIVRVRVLETSDKLEAIQGATVLLRRDKDKTLGRVTKMDGRCNFMPIPATYSIRVQLTGYKNLEAAGLLFESGKVYELDLRLARN